MFVLGFLWGAVSSVASGPKAGKVQSWAPCLSTFHGGENRLTDCTQPFPCVLYLVCVIPHHSHFFPKKATFLPQDERYRVRFCSSLLRTVPFSFSYSLSEE